MKKLLTGILVAFAIGGAVLGVMNQAAKPDESTGTALPAGLESEPSKSTPDHIVTVTYFTTNVRCPSCLKIEELTRQTVQSHFGRELAGGTVVFQLINTDQPENQHYIEDYQLVSKTVVVAEFDKGEPGDWVNLQDVWLKLNDEQAFEAYVAQAVTTML